MLKIGILGASGFIGGRATQLLKSSGHSVKAIVRSKDSLNRLNQLVPNVEFAIANAFDQRALYRAFSGCDIVIDSILGSPGLIRGSIDCTYKAASRAGVKRFIYLSSFCVHGQSPKIGTTEASPISEGQLFPYNDAKVWAEQRLLQLRKDNGTEVVIFRPGIVFGPRSKRVLEIASELLKKKAYLIDGGEGICNSVYVDNLIHAIELSLECADVDGEAFFVRDGELVSWKLFYESISDALGIPSSSIKNVDSSQYSLVEEPSKFKDSAVYQKAIASIPASFKGLSRERRKPSSGPKLPKRVDISEHSASSDSAFTVSREMLALQQCNYLLPMDKATNHLGFKPKFSFSDACLQTTAWLRQIA